MPDVVLFELLFDPCTKSLRSHFEEVLHSGLGVDWLALVLPDVVQGNLDLVDELGDLAKLKCIYFGEGLADGLEEVINYFCFGPQLLVLLRADVLPLVLLPALNLIDRTQDASELVLLEVLFVETTAAFSDCFVQTGLQTEE